MKLTPPKQITFWISIALAVLGLVALFAIPAIAAYAIWIVLAGFVLLVVALLVKGL